MFRSLTNFQQRFFMGLLGIALLAGIIILSHKEPFQLLFVASVALIQALALSEYYNMAKRKACTPQSYLGITASVLWVFLSYFYPQNAHLGLFLFALLALTFSGLFKNSPNALANAASTLFGVVYITIPMAFFIDINYKTNTSFWIVYLITVTKMTDTSAYIAGKTAGRHLLVPKLSPKKTWEGAIAGLVAPSVTSVIFLWVANLYAEYDFSHLEAALFGLSIGAFAQIGDLAESLLKRDVDIKDSNSLPGFGGFLDIIDSLIFTTPLVLFWLKMKHML